MTRLSEPPSLTPNQQRRAIYIAAEYRELRGVLSPIQRILTDRGTEYCGKAESHDYQLYLALNDIEHTKTKARTPQTNGICERFHKTILQEFYQVTFRKKFYGDMQALQADLDAWLDYYNTSTYPSE